TALDFLPRQAFLGSVLRDAHGADKARQRAADEAEHAVVTFLPPEVVLNPHGKTRGELLIVQPDATIAGPSSYVLLEAKRIEGGSSQPQQLAREYLAVTRAAHEHTPLLLLVLGAPPPIKVTGLGRMSIADAIRLHLPALRAVVDHPRTLEELDGLLDETCA